MRLLAELAQAGLIGTYGAVILVGLSGLAAVLHALAARLRAGSAASSGLTLTSDALDAFVEVAHKHEHGEPLLQAALEEAQSPAGQAVLADILALVRARKAASAPDTAGVASEAPGTEPPTSGGGTNS